jgi:hypothetical protein
MNQVQSLEAKLTVRIALIERKLNSLNRSESIAQRKQDTLKLGHIRSIERRLADSVLNLRTSRLLVSNKVKAHHVHTSAKPEEQVPLKPQKNSPPIIRENKSGVFVAAMQQRLRVLEARDALYASRQLHAARLRGNSENHDAAIDRVERLFALQESTEQRLLMKISSA